MAKKRKVTDTTASLFAEKPGKEIKGSELIETQLELTRFYSRGGAAPNTVGTALGYGLEGATIIRGSMARESISDQLLSSVNGFASKMDRAYTGGLMGDMAVLDREEVAERTAIAKKLRISPYVLADKEMMAEAKKYINLKSKERELGVLISFQLEQNMPVANSLIEEYEQVAGLIKDKPMQLHATEGAIALLTNGWVAGFHQQEYGKAVSAYYDGNPTEEKRQRMVAAEQQMIDSFSLMRNNPNFVEDTIQKSMLLFGQHADQAKRAALYAIYAYGLVKTAGALGLIGSVPGTMLSTGGTGFIASLTGSSVGAAQAKMIPLAIRLGYAHAGYNTEYGFIAGGLSKTTDVNGKPYDYETIRQASMVAAAINTGLEASEASFLMSSFAPAASGTGKVIAAAVTPYIAKAIRNPEVRRVLQETTKGAIGYLVTNTKEVGVETAQAVSSEWLAPMLADKIQNFKERRAGNEPREFARPMFTDIPQIMSDEFSNVWNSFLLWTLPGPALGTMRSIAYRQQNELQSIRRSEVAQTVLSTYINEMGRLSLTAGDPDTATEFVNRLTGLYNPQYTTLWMDATQILENLAELSNEDASRILNNLGTDFNSLQIASQAGSKVAINAGDFIVAYGLDSDVASWMLDNVVDVPNGHTRSELNTAKSEYMAKANKDALTSAGLATNTADNAEVVVAAESVNSENVYVSGGFVGEFVYSPENILNNETVDNIAKQFGIAPEALLAAIENNDLIEIPVSRIKSGEVRSDLISLIREDIRLTPEGYTVREAMQTMFPFTEGVREITPDDIQAVNNALRAVDETKQIANDVTARLLSLKTEDSIAGAWGDTFARFIQMISHELNMSPMEFYRSSVNLDQIRYQPDLRLDRTGEPVAGMHRWRTSFKDPVSILLHPKATGFTIVHEFIHTMLNMVALAYEQNPDNAKLAKLMEDITTLYGERGEEGAFSSEGQEAFVDTFMKYLYEGKAPTPQLKTAFAQFKRWLAWLYEQLKSSNLPISDEARSIFDRMLIVEREADSVLAEFGLDTVQNLDEIGATPNAAAEQNSAIISDAKAQALIRVSEELNKAEALLKSEEYRAAYDRAMNELLTESNYIIARIFRDNPDIRLSRELIIEQYGEEVLSALPDYIYSENGTLSADDVMTMFGITSYASGQDMLVSLATMLPAEQEADNRARTALGIMGPDEVRQLARRKVTELLTNAPSLERAFEIRDGIRVARGITEAEWRELEADHGRLVQLRERGAQRRLAMRILLGDLRVDGEALRTAVGDEAYKAARKKLGAEIFRPNANGQTFGLDVIARELAAAGVAVSNGADVATLLTGDVYYGLTPLEKTTRGEFNSARRYLNRLRADLLAENRQDAAINRRLQADERAARDEDRLIRAQRKITMKNIKEFAAQKARLFKASGLTNQMTALTNALANAYAQYAEAIVARDFDAAEVASNKIVLNQALLNETKKAQRELVTARRLSKEAIAFVRKGQGKQIWSIGGEWVAQMTNILQQYGMLDLDEGYAPEESLQSFVDRRSEEYAINPVADWIVMGRSMNMRDFTVAQWIDVANALTWLRKDGREATQVTIANEKMSYAQLVQDLKATAASVFRQQFEAALYDDDGNILYNIPDRKQMESTERLKAISLDILAGGLKIETIVNMLDGHNNRQGPWWRALFMGFVDGQDTDSSLRREYSAIIKSIIDETWTQDEQTNSLHVKQFYPVLNTGHASHKGNFTRMELVMAGAHMGNDGNRTMLMRGFNWTEQQLEFIQRTLTPKEWAAIERIWRMFDSLGNLADAHQEQMTGFRMKKIALRPLAFMMSNGQLFESEGGYFPLVRDLSQIKGTMATLGEGGLILNDPQSNPFAKGYIYPTTQKGYLKLRNEQAAYRVSLDMGIIHSHINTVIRDIAYRKPLQDAMRLIKNKDINAIMRTALGDSVVNQIQPAIEHIALGDRTVEDGINMLARMMIRRTQVVSIGFKIGSMLAQVQGFGPAASEVGGARLARHIASFWLGGDYKDRVSFVYSLSEFMRVRNENRDRDMGQAIRDIQTVGARSAYRRTMNQIETWSFAGVNFMDKVVVLPIWTAAYEQALEQGRSQKDAVYYADSVVRRTQDIGTAKDLSAWQRGGPVKKLFTMFYNAGNSAYNLMAENYVAMKTGQITKAQFMGQFFYISIFPAMIALALRGELPDFSEDEDPMDAVLTVNNWIMSNTAFYTAGFLPVIRDAAGIWEYNLSGAPSGISPAAETTKAVRNIYRATSRSIEEGEFGEDFVRAMTMNGIMAAGYTMGLPSGQFKLVMKAWLDYIYEAEGVNFVSPFFRNEWSDFGRKMEFFAQ